MIDYTDQDILIVTKHSKENVIAPHLISQLNCKVKVTENFDTDQFGTFSGEVERMLSAKDTCIKKATDAAKHYNYEYAIASEGSFGPDPSMPFIPCDIEYMSFVDLKNNIIITEHCISNNTNYSYMDIDKLTAYENFLDRIKFPSHAIILREIDQKKIIAKGIIDKDEIANLIQKAFLHNEKLRIETDMRAMHNPTRMNVIETLAEKLAKRIKAHCRKCETPGFGAIRPYGKLNCECCGNETKLYRVQQTYCEWCDFFENQPRTDGKEKAPPDYCDYCNP